ncbi:MAG: hypothetical protein U1E05_00650, partial [Patescibacteria group bacterium]|nr:hypothetical protein [Patescibacteria group bacterium]
LAECHVNSGLGGPFGGLYWLMNLLLPGYLRFRYPAKLLVVTSLALSLLAARGWDRAFDGRTAGARRLFLALGGVSLLGLIGAIVIRPFWSGWLAATPPNQLFGPLDATGAWRDLAGAFLQTTLLCAAGTWLFHAHGKRNWGRAGGGARAVAQGAVLLLVAADLGWSNAWLVATVPGETAVSQSRFGRIVASEDSTTDADGAAPRRAWRHPLWMPAAWREKADANRLAASMRFDRDTLWPNYNLDMRIAMAEVSGTMMLRDYANFLARHRFTAGDRPVAVLDLVSHAVLPVGTPMPAGWLPVAHAEDAVLWRNRRPLPRAWIAGTDSDARPRSLDGESCRVVHFDPRRVELDAALVAPGLVVLAEQFYPGWHLEVSGAGEGSRQATIERVHGVLRAARLPAGRYRLTFLYRPWSFVFFAGISAAGWLALAVGAVVGFRACASRTQSSAGLSAGAASN